MKKYRKLIQLIFIYVLFVVMLVHFESKSEASNIKSIWDGFWYSFVTLTTVGYGDSFPVTDIGKFIGLFFIFASLGMLGYIVGLITEKINDRMENKNKGEFGTNFKNHFIKIGWNAFSRMVAEQVINAGKKVAIITDNLTDIELIYSQFGKSKVFVLFSDLNNYQRFNKAKMENAVSILVNYNDDSKNLINLINLKKLYPKPKYVVSLKNGELKDTFSATGVTFSISENEVASKLVASYVFEPDVALFTEDLMGSAISKDDHDISQFYINDASPLVGEDYLDTFINLKQNFNAILLGVSRLNKQGYTLIKNPSKKITLKATDYIVLIANGANINQLEKYFKTSEGQIEVN